MSRFNRADWVRSWIPGCARRRCLAVEQGRISQRHQASVTLNNNCNVSHPPVTAVDQIDQPPGSGRGSADDRPDLQINERADNLVIKARSSADVRPAKRLRGRLQIAGIGGGSVTANWRCENKRCRTTRGDARVAFACRGR